MAKYGGFTTYRQIVERCAALFTLCGDDFALSHGGYDVMFFMAASAKMLKRRIEVERHDDLDPAVAGLARRYPDHDLIALNSRLSRPVMRFTAAKELGHLHFHPHRVSNLDFPPSVKLTQIMAYDFDGCAETFPDERIAFIFALELMMPSFKPDAVKVMKAHAHDHGRLAQEFGIPSAFVKLRMLPMYPPIARK